MCHIVCGETPSLLIHSVRVRSACALSVCAQRAGDLEDEEAVVVEVDPALPQEGAHLGEGRRLPTQQVPVHTRRSAGSAGSAKVNMFGEKEHIPEAELRWWTHKYSIIAALKELRGVFNQVALLLP